MRLELPYGLWTCSDGREVLFNRWYQPIWQRHSGGQAQPIDPAERIRWAEQSWFYKDGNPPWYSKASLALCEGVLAQWGLPAPDPQTERRKPSVFRNELYRGDGQPLSAPAPTATADVIPFTRPVA